MKRSLKKMIAGVISAAMVLTVSAPVMADNAKPQVYVNFICDGQTSGKYVPAGSNVTAPSVPLHAGFTFCGFDKSLYNVNANTTYVAVYMNNQLGEEAIKQKKASLPTPAISATTVADPNAAAAQTALPVAAQGISAVNMASVLAMLQAQQAAVNTASVNAAAAAKAAAKAAAPAAQNAAAAALQAVNAAAANPQVQAAAQAAANAAANPQVQEAAKAAAAAAATATAAATPQVQAVTQTASVLPSWAVSLHGVNQAGVAEVYKYWKTVKNADDATIQANWDALLNHYAGHGTQGW